MKFNEFLQMVVEDCVNGEPAVSEVWLRNLQREVKENTPLSPRLEWDSWRNEDDPDDSVRAAAAKHLRLIAADVRSAGDVPLVRLSEEGVTPESVTLADELELIAIQLAGL